jgi:hypothetical protein
MLFYMQHNVQIAGGASELPNLATARKSDARSVFDSRWNFSVNSALAQNATFAFALRAGIGNHAACALARRAGSSDAEEALLVADLTAAGA